MKLSFLCVRGSLQLDTRLQALFSPALSDYLAMDPTRLLPITQYPAAQLMFQAQQARRRGLERRQGALGDPRVPKGSALQERL